MPGFDLKSTFARLKAQPEPRGLDLVCWIAVGLVCLGLSIWFNQFGLLHFEWRQYTPYHLAPGSIWIKIFNSRLLDLDTYSGRELSYLVDHLDILFVAASVKLGCPLFVSITHLVLAIYIGVWVGWFAARDLRLGTTIGLLLALLFWSTSYVYLHFLIRTAKILSAAAAVTVLVELHRAHARTAPGRWLHWRFLVTLASSTLVLAFADRQGFFFLLFICAFTGLTWLIQCTHAMGQAFALLAAVIYAEIIYFNRIVPALTRLFFDYTPNLAFNDLPFTELFKDPGAYAANAANALADSLRFLLGNMPPWLLTVAGLALMVRFAFEVRHHDWRQGLPTTLFILTGALLIWVMFALMILRHPPIIWPDIKRVYYWLPTGAVALLALAFALSGRFTSAPGRGRNMAAAALLLGVLANLSALPDHRRVFISGHLHDSIVHSTEVREALLLQNFPGYVAPDPVLNDPTYQTLRSYRR